MASEFGYDILRVTAVVPVDVVLRIDKLAAKAGKSRSQYVAELLAKEAVGVSLNDHDREVIADFIAAAKVKRAKKRARS